MVTTQLGTSAVDFEFINVTGDSEPERRRNNYTARAHAARINRQNYKSRAESRRSKHATTFSILPKSSKEPKSKGFSTDEGASSEDVRSRRARSSISFNEKSASNTPVHSPDGEAPDSFEMCPTPQSISPAYVALAIDTFDWISQPLSAQVGHYCKRHRLVLT